MIQEQFADAIELAREWTGECPDRVPEWDRETLLVDWDRVDREIEVMVSAALLGDLGAIHCSLEDNRDGVEDAHEISLQASLMWIEYARLLGDDPSRLAELRALVEGRLTEELRDGAVEMAAENKRDLDWVAAQGWLED